MKKNLFRALSLVLIGFVAMSCSTPSKMAKNADQLGTTCEPEVLEVVAGKIDASYSIAFPEKYFNPKAEMRITPVMVFDGTEVAGEVTMLQGEKVAANGIVVPKDGATITRKVTFDYVPGMEKSTLELRAVVLKGTKEYPVAKPFEIADGANTTYMLVKTAGELVIAPDKYQKVIRETKEAQILYMINNATVRSSQLKKEEVKEFQNFLADIEKDRRRTVHSADVIAYASPDGELDLNTELSQKREKSASAAFDKLTKKTPIETVNVSNVSEDWDGFKELVEESDIADKELILRVLSMYDDPVVREREIKNMSSVFKVLADKVLPELRRARYIANIDYMNYTDDELATLVQENIEILDEEAILYSATLFEDNGTKLYLYRKAAEKFNSSRAYNNIAALYLSMNNVDKAAKALENVAEKDCYYYNNMGMVEVRQGNMEAAAANFAKSQLPQATANMAIVDILNGDYEAAVAKLAGKENCNTALAHLLVGQLDESLKAADCACPRSAYIRAIIAARRGDAQTVKAELEKASVNKNLAKRAKTDIEFARF